MFETPSHRLEVARRTAKRLRGARSIAVSTHVNGDGDGWGSACALAHHFGGSDCDVRLLAATPIPERFRFLLPEGVEPYDPDEGGIEALRTADVQIVVDASERRRLGEFAPHYLPDRTVVIDHHAVATEEIEAALALVDPDAAATAELVYDVLLQTGDPVDAPTACALYVGLVTDTGSFRYSNSTPQAHRTAAALIEAGADPGALYRPLFANLNVGELGTLQAALAEMQRDEEHGITWTVLDLDASRRFGALEEYEPVIEHLRNLTGTQVAILFRELEGGEVKISLRSIGPADVAAVARSFGGGGHKKAAGATIAGSVAEVTTLVLAACRAALAGPAQTRS
ncbi:MAG: DHH family phosphoesterase [Gemmatimonadota bacterium]|nr:MAG: DHH family phosphoesterase [Gemmatimonadota bacterium]